MKNCNCKSIIIAGAAAWLVNTIFVWLTCGWLFSWVYMIPPLIWKSPEAYMGVSALICSNVIGLIAGLIFAYVYSLVYKALPGQGINKGLTYGLIVWALGALSSMATMSIYMTISIVVVIYWILQALVVNIIKGVIVSAIVKEN